MTQGIQLDTNSEVQDKEYMPYMIRNIVHAVRSPPLNCVEKACLNATDTVGLLED